MSFGNKHFCRGDKCLFFLNEIPSSNWSQIIFLLGPLLKLMNKLCHIFKKGKMVERMGEMSGMMAKMAKEREIVSLRILQTIM